MTLVESCLLPFVPFDRGITAEAWIVERLFIIGIREVHTTWSVIAITITGA